MLFCSPASQEIIHLQKGNLWRLRNHYKSEQNCYSYMYFHLCCWSMGWKLSPLGWIKWNAGGRLLGSDYLVPVSWKSCSALLGNSYHPQSQMTKCWITGYVPQTPHSYSEKIQHYNKHKNAFKLALKISPNTFNTNLLSKDIFLGFGLDWIRRWQPEVDSLWSSGSVIPHF